MLQKISKKSLAFAIIVLLLVGCKAQTDPKELVDLQDSMLSKSETTESLATFAGGCFWCMEPAFEVLDGVSEVISGYAGGTEEEATYKQVSTGKTGHREAVQVHYNPAVVSYEMLLESYFHQIDPTDDGGQFSDRGPQYTTAIYYHNDYQKALAEKMIRDLEKGKKFDQPIVTLIKPYTTFFHAEDYHQDFYKKSAEYYERYKKGSGRQDFIDENWSKKEALKYSRESEASCDSYQCFTKPSAETLKKKLTALQYKVTQQNGTEQAFRNEYWNNEAEGIYVDIISGEPLFSSRDKYDSQTGWPSFTKPISMDLVKTNIDYELGYPRTEVRSKIADSHLGHVFDDGPKDKGGKRWCINSAALKFIPKEELFGDYLIFQDLFD